MSYNIIEIAENMANFGIYAYFTANDKEYYADITDVMFCGPECMIFPSENKQVTSWGELYCNRDVTVCRSSLEQCIEEFVNSL